MNMKDMIQRMTDLEDKAKQQLNEGCGDMPAAPMDRGNPVSVSVNLNASGKEHVADLLDMMKQAGLGSAKELQPDMMPMRTDMERLRDIVDGPKALPAPEDEEMDDEPLEGYENEPDEQYDDHETMTHDLSGGINRQKKMYKKAADGDSDMAVESIKDQLYAMLSEKKAKPDFLDLDGDGDTKEPMKKAAADKKKGAVGKKDEKVAEAKSAAQKAAQEKFKAMVGKKKGDTSKKTEKSKMMPKGKKRPVKESTERKLSFKQMVKLVQESGGQQQIDPKDQELFAWAQRVARTKLGEDAKAEIYAGLVYERMGGRFQMYDVLSENTVVRVNESRTYNLPLRVSGLDVMKKLPEDAIPRFIETKLGLPEGSMYFDGDDLVLIDQTIAQARETVGDMLEKTKQYIERNPDWEDGDMSDQVQFGETSVVKAKPVVVNGKQVDLNSIEFSIYGTDSDQYDIEDARFVDGTPLSDREIQQLYRNETIIDMHQDELQDYHSGSDSKLRRESAGGQSDKTAEIQAWAKKYGRYRGANGDSLPEGWLQYQLNTGVPSDAYEDGEYEAMMAKYGEDEVDDNPDIMDEMPITKSMFADLTKIFGGPAGEYEAEEVNKVLGKKKGDTSKKTEKSKMMPKGKEFGEADIDDYLDKTKSSTKDTGGRRKHSGSRYGGSAQKPDSDTDAFGDEVPRKKVKEQPVTTEASDYMNDLVKFAKVVQSAKTSEQLKTAKKMGQNLLRKYQDVPDTRLDKIGKALGHDISYQPGRENDVEDELYRKTKELGMGL